jgi:hypothetical protein
VDRTFQLIIPKVLLPRSLAKTYNSAGEIFGCALDEEFVAGKRRIPQLEIATALNATQSGSPYVFWILVHFFLDRCRALVSCTIHHRCDVKSFRIKRRHWCHLIGFDSLFQKNPGIYPARNEQLSHEMNLKIQHIRVGLKLTKPKVGQ